MKRTAAIVAALAMLCAFGAGAQQNDPAAHREIHPLASAMPAKHVAVPESYSTTDYLQITGTYPYVLFSAASGSAWIQAGIDDTGTAAGPYVWFHSGNPWYFDTNLLLKGSSRLGVGTFTPQYDVDVLRNAGSVTAAVRNSSQTGTASLLITTGDGTSSPRQAFVQMLANEPSGRNWNVGMVGANGEFRIRDVTAGNIDRMIVGTDGNIIFNGIVSGTVIHANYQDVAEWVPTREALADGMVVVLDPEHANSVIRSTKPYDTTAAGVVSSRPGVELGVPGESKALIATTGRVRVHVDASKGAIRIGDLLVTGEMAGTAMKSQAVDIGGISIHRPGTVIGKALEPLDHGTGDILVLLSLQ